MYYFESKINIKNLLRDKIILTTFLTENKHYFYLFIFVFYIDMETYPEKKQNLFSPTNLVFRLAF